MSLKRFWVRFATYGTWAVIFIALSFLSLEHLDREFGSGFYFQNYRVRQAQAEAAAETVAPLKRWSHENSDLLPDRGAVFGHLKNGFRYVLMVNHKPKGRVSMHLNVKAGSLHESDAQQGLAHFLEHMLFNGSTHFKPGELVKYFQSIGMQFGPDANAHTGYNKTVYDILLPDSSRESLQQGLIVMKDYAGGALLLQTEIDRERRVVLAEKRTRDSASYRTYASTMKFEFPDALISSRLPIGIEKVLKNADRREFKDYYDVWYRPEKMILVMVGDFNADQAKTLIEDTFSSLSPRAPPGPEPDLGAIHHEGMKPFYHFEKETGHTEVSIEAVEKVSREPDSHAFRSRRLKAQVADRIVQNRLDALVRKPETPFTSASIGSGIFLHEVAFADITAESSPENWKKSLELVEQTLRQALQFGFTATELERVQRDYLSELDRAVKNASTRDSRHLARRIMGSVNADRVFMSPAQEKEMLVPLINSLTLKSVHESFKATWSPGHRLIIVTGNAELNGKEKEPDHQILAAYTSSSKVKVIPPLESNLVRFPYLPEPDKEERIVQRTTIPDLDIVQVDFDNGVRLNLKKTDFEANEVWVKLSFGSGRSAEPADLAGLSVLAAKIVNESGLGTINKEEIKRALAGKSTTVSFNIGESRFHFDGKTVSEEMLLLFQLLYSHLTDPGFREDAFTLSMERFAQSYQKLESSIDGAMLLAGKRFLAGGDSRFGLPDYEKFRQLTLDQVRSWFQASLRTEDIEVSVVGDFDVEPVVKIASKYIGSLPRSPRAGIEKKPKPPQFPVNKSLLIPVETKIPKGVVVVAYPSEDLWDIKRTRRFSILAEIVSDRLREEIREKLGAAYSAFAFNRPSRAYPGYGVFQIMIYVDPAEVDLVVSAVKELISDLAESGASEDELTRAIAPTLTSIKDMKRKNNYWLNTVLNGSEQYPQQLEWSRTIMTDYASITKEEVSALARQYLDNRKATIIIAKPETK